MICDSETMIIKFITHKIREGRRKGHPARDRKGPKFFVRGESRSKGKRNGVVVWAEAEKINPMMGVFIYVGYAVECSEWDVRKKSSRCVHGVVTFREVKVEPIEARGVEFLWTGDSFEKRVNRLVNLVKIKAV